MSYLKPSWNGVPEHAQHATWHWLRLHGKAFAAPLQWDCHMQEWIDGNKRMSAQEVSRIYSYQQPIIGAVIYQPSPNREWMV